MTAHQLLEEKDIEKSRAFMEKRAEMLQTKQEIYSLLSDATRLKLILLLGEHEELCPTDLSNIVGISMSAVSHQLRLLEMVGLTTKQKHGKVICYRLSPKGEEFVQELTS